MKTIKEKMNKNNLAQEARKELGRFVEEIDKRLEKYWDGEVESDFGFNHKQKSLVREAILHSKEHNLRSAKRVRGAFVYCGYMLGSQIEDERIWKAAMGIELVHTALLMHDDFMDEDEVRRGKETTHKYYEHKPWGNKHYGETMAVGVGDGVLCLGFELVNGCGFPSEQVNRATQQLLRGIANTAWGQAYDVSLEAMQEWTEEDVIVLHKAKTAIYTYENPLFVGAHLAGVSGEVMQILHDYSMDGGVAFQLQDDILGVYGDEEKTGKSADSDIKQGKCTLMIKAAFDSGSKEQVDCIKKVWGNRQASRADLDGAKSAIRESGAYEYNKKLAQEYALRAAKTAEKLRNFSVNKRAVDFIQGIAEYMVEREV